MSRDKSIFVEWEEHVISQEKGNRVVHYYLKVSSGDLILAVVGTERSIRHMIYVVSDEFMRAYGCKGSINACTKWRARREVVDWLNWLVAKHGPPPALSNSWGNRSAQSLGSREFSLAGVTNLQSHPPDQMVQVPRKLNAQSSDIEWSGDAWICCKQLKHYPAFCRNGTTIAVYSFVFIMAEEKGHYLGYLEDMYEDKKRRKKVKVRWFHHSQEINNVIRQVATHPKEVLITPYVQAISAECIDGLATVLTPKHYAKCSAVISQVLSSGIYLCSSQFKNKEVKPFSLSKLRGYSNQAILFSLDRPLVSKPKSKKHRSDEAEKEDSTQETAKTGPTYRKLKIKLSSKGAIGIKLVASKSQPQPQSFKVDEKIELLCQDSGIRGCWFRCKVLQASEKLLKVHYEDVEDVERSGNIEEWVPESRVAAPDKLHMRCPGRLTIRPWPPEDLPDYSFEVGAPVDAWWGNGWWEGVVVGTNIYGSDNLRVYLPGEDRFLTLQRKNVRTSKDWVNNRWLHVKAKPDILSIISPNVSARMKLQSCTTPKLETVKEEKQELAVSMTTDDLETVEGINWKKRRCGDEDDD